MDDSSDDELFIPCDPDDVKMGAIERHHLEETVVPRIVFDCTGYYYHGVDANNQLAAGEYCVEGRAWPPCDFINRLIGFSIAFKHNSANIL